MNLKTYILSFTFSICYFVAFAQPEVVNEAAKLIQEGKIEDAKIQIDKAITHPDTKDKALTWYYRGYICKDLFKTSKDTSFRNEAIKSLKISIELDSEHEYDGEDKKIIQFLATGMYNEAVESLNLQRFELANSLYKQYLNAMKITDPNYNENKVIFYIGYTAYMNQNIDEAIDYFEQAKALNYNDPLLYQYLGKEYWEKGDKDKAIAILEEGTENHPHYTDIVLLEISYLITMGKWDELEPKLNRAINLKPDDVELKRMLAIIYEKRAKLEKDKKDELIAKSREIYKAILTTSPDDFKANYNLGLSFYNEAVDKMNSIDEEEDDLFALFEIQDANIELFKQALPYMEKAHNLQPENQESLIGLSGIYFSLNNAEKAKEVEDKLAALKAKNK